MRYIQKNNRASIFEKWKKDKAVTQETAWKELHGEPKKDLKVSLLAEQQCLCAYCEARIDMGKMTIDHLVPKSKEPGSTFEYQNLLACCDGGSPAHEGGVSQQEGKGQKGKNESCNPKKENEILPLSPLFPEIGSQFTFTQREIQGISPEANKTIKILGLNCERLKNERESKVKGYLQPLRPNLGGFDEVISVEEAALLLERLEKEAIEFDSAVKYNLRKIAQR